MVVDATSMFLKDDDGWDDDDDDDWGDDEWGNFLMVLSKFMMMNVMMVIDDFEFVVVAFEARDVVERVFYNFVFVVYCGCVLFKYNILEFNLFYVNGLFNFILFDIIFCVKTFVDDGGACVDFVYVVVFFGGLFKYVVVIVIVFIVIGVMGCFGNFINKVIVVFKLFDRDVVVVFFFGVFFFGEFVVVFIVCVFDFVVVFFVCYRDCEFIFGVFDFVFVCVIV